MKIICIFEDQLYSVQYDNTLNEFDRLLDVWSDVNYLSEFANKYEVRDKYVFIEELLKNLEELENFINSLILNKQSLDQYFQPLQLSEYQKELSFQKGKLNKNRLRIYALRVDSDCYLVTGGAIKMSQRMDENEETLLELSKLIAAREYLKSEGVFDDGSFFELIFDQK